jgi:hypothetical protein
VKNLYSTRSKTALLRVQTQVAPPKGVINNRTAVEDGVVPKLILCHGASGISTLTDAENFWRLPGYERLVRPETHSLPLLRKDFMIDDIHLLTQHKRLARCDLADSSLSITAGSKSTFRCCSKPWPGDAGTTTTENGKWIIYAIDGGPGWGEQSRTELFLFVDFYIFMRWTWNIRYKPGEAIR